MGKPSTIDLANGLEHDDFNLAADPLGTCGEIKLNNTRLIYAAHVDTRRIPLYLAISSAFYVREGTLAYRGLAESLVSAPVEYGSWNDDECPTTGVLLQCPKPVKAVELDTSVPVSEYPVTEIVVYAERRFLRDVQEGLVGVGSDLCLRAVLLSSHLFYAAASFSQQVDSNAEARFLPDPLVHASPETECLHDTTSTKRGSIDTIFDSAAELRRKVRKKGGDSVGLAASRGTPQRSSPLTKAEDDDVECMDKTLPTVNVLQGRHRRPSTHAAAAAAAAVAKPAEPPSRPSSRTGPERKRSSLSQVQTPEDTSFDARNRQTIAKTVMAGMRMYGLQQRKTEAESDDEYKMVYHQTFKGAVFACRREIYSVLLKPDAVREVIDRLLAVFCGEVC